MDTLFVCFLGAAVVYLLAFGVFLLYIVWLLLQEASPFRKAKASAPKAEEGAERSQDKLWDGSR